MSHIVGHAQTLNGTLNFAVGYGLVAESRSDTLFGHARRNDPSLVPLAERMRPRGLEDFVGQEHLTGTGRILARIIASDRVPSMILWGPPGTGKTTLARIIAAKTGAIFETLSATDSGVKDLRAAVERARTRRDYDGRATILFVDEIHRFNRAQQDSLLPHVESGVCTLIGATTENPSFEVNAALLSRARVIQLREIGIGDLIGLLQRALADPIHGLGRLEIRAEESLLTAIARRAQGDARRCLNALELAVDLLPDEDKALTLELVAAALGEPNLRYDRAGEEHYNVTSALIKSMRASDPDAAVYWMARMLEAGEDPMFVVRRLVIFASEDIGNADPQALVLAAAAADAVHLMGMPEAVLPLTQAAVYLALAPKSNTALKAYFTARKEIRSRGAEPVPLEVRNAVTGLMKKMGYGGGYRYPHDFAKHVQPEHNSHLPELLRAHLPGRRYVHSGDLGWEAEAERQLAAHRSSSFDEDETGDESEPKPER